jgi:PAS domain S-box-containing protein
MAGFACSGDPDMAAIAFLSHVVSDEKAARVLATALSRVSLEQLEIWFSSDPSPAGGIKPGQIWVNEIKAQLLASNVILVLLTPNSLTRPWIYFESGCGFSKQRVIPICLGIKISEVPFPLAMFQCYEIEDFCSLSHFFRKLFDLLRIRFDDEMSEKILRCAVKRLGQVSNWTQPVVEPNSQTLGVQLSICTKKLCEMWDKLPTPMHRINQTGVICAVNKEWLRFFGYELKDVIGKPANFLMTPESAELAMLMVIPKFWEMGFCEGVSYEYKKKSGEIVNVVLDCVALTDNDGIRTSLSFVRPLINHRLPQGMCRESNAEAEHNGSESLVGYYETDLQGDFSLVSPCLSKVLGFEKRTLLGKNFRDVVDPGTARKIYVAFHKVFSNRVERSNHTWQIRHKNGTTTSVNSTVSLITEPNGKAVGFRGTVQLFDELKGLGRQRLRKVNLDDEDIWARNGKSHKLQKRRARGKSSS